MAQVIGFQIVIDGLGKTVETATELKRAIAEVNAELKKTTDVQEIKKLETKLVDLNWNPSLKIFPFPLLQPPKNPVNS